MRALAVLLVLSQPAWGDEVPLELGTTVLLKVLSYDAAFETRGSGDFVVLVPYASDDKARVEAAVRELSGGVARSKLRSRGLQFYAVKGAELAAEARDKKVAAILALDASPESLLADIARVAREQKAYSLGVGEQAVTKSFVALGVTVKDGKPQVIINVPQTKALGAEFPQSILKVARLVH